MINYMAEAYNYMGCICNLISEQKLFGKVICTVYIPEFNKVERVLRELLLSVDARELQTSPEELQAIAAAGKVFDVLNNYSQTFGEDVLPAPLDSAVSPLPHQLDTLKCWKIYSFQPGAGGTIFTPRTLNDHDQGLERTGLPRAIKKSTKCTTPLAVTGRYGGGKLHE